MERLDFYKLTRPVQERFIGSTNGTGMPSPILDLRVTPKEPRLWLAVFIVAALGVALLFRLGHGNLESGMAIQPLPIAGAYVGLVAVSVFGLLHALKIWGEVRGLPFRPGIYVFPIGLIDARRKLITVHKIEELTKIDGPSSGQVFQITAGGTTYALPARDQAHAIAAKEALSQAKAMLENADAAKDSIRPKALAALNPLHGVVNPLVPASSISRSPPPWARLDWLFSIVVGGLVGCALWALHNAKSDDAMYTKAAAQNDVASLQAYLARGSRHREEVANILLPRAELKQAEASGSVDAVEKYIRRHPTTGIPAEVSAALRKAMVGELLEKAKQAGTLAALNDFAERHPDHHMEGDLRAARHAVYVAALEAYKKTAPAKGDAPAFFERLIAYAERKGGAVQVRFHRVVPKSMEKADTAVSKNKFFNGVVSLPSRYFDPPHSKPREAALGAALIARFSQAFPSEILSFSVGPSVDDPEAPLPPPTVPTLFIDHGADWTGGLATSQSPRGVFVGIGFAFVASFQIPDDPKPRAFKTTVYRSPSPADGKEADKPEEKIYEEMSKDGFEQFTKRYLSTYFAK